MPWCNYLADLAILSGLVYNLETTMTIIAEEAMYESTDDLVAILALRPKPKNMSCVAYSF